MNLVNTLDEVIDCKIGAYGCPDELNKCEDDINVEQGFNQSSRMRVGRGGWLKFPSLGTLIGQQP